MAAQVVPARFQSDVQADVGANGGFAGFDLPKAEDITALGFVIRLEDGSAEKRRQRVADYVLTRAVPEALPPVFGKMADIPVRGEGLGRFIHGSFGSGKSHLMGFVGLLLEDDIETRLYKRRWYNPDYESEERTATPRQRATALLALDESSPKPTSASPTPC